MTTFAHPGISRRKSGGSAASALSPLSTTATHIAAREDRPVAQRPSATRMRTPTTRPTTSWSVGASVTIGKRMTMRSSTANRTAPVLVVGFMALLRPPRPRRRAPRRRALIVALRDELCGDLHPFGAPRAFTSGLFGEHLVEDEAG